MKQGEPGRVKKTKYSNQRTVVDGIAFASKAEAKRYGELKLLEKAGEIFDLRLQPRYKLAVNGAHVCTYVADFKYVKRGKDVDTVEDVKGMRTALYSLKAKLMKACYGIVIQEIR